MTATQTPGSIVRMDGVLGGEPVIAGTRTPVRAVVENWRLGIPLEDIPNHLPHLTHDQVSDALRYFDENPDEIEDYIERNRIPAVPVAAAAGR